MKKTNRFAQTLLTTAVLAGLNKHAVAQDIQSSQAELERIAVVEHRQAYRGDVPLKDLPQSINVIYDEILDNMGILDLQTALTFSSGVASQNNFGGLWDSFALRGFAGDENSPSGYLVNGFNVGRGFSGKRDTSNIEVIEVLKGPGSALYGRGEPGGTINVITKKPQFEREGYIDLTLGSHDLYRIEGDFTDAINSDFAYRVNGAYQDAGSFRDTVHSQKLSFTPSVVYVLNDATSLFYELEVLQQEAPFDRGIVVLDYNFGAVPINTFYGEPADGTIDIKALGHQLSLQHQLTRGWQIHAGISYRDSSFEGFSTEPELAASRQLLYSDGQTVSRQRRYRDYDATDLSARFELSTTINSAGLSHHIMLGADAYEYQLDQMMERWRPGAGDSSYAVNLMQPQYGQALPSLAPLTNKSEQQQSIGVYLQDQIDLSEQWQVLLGLRLDDFEQELSNNAASTSTKQAQSATSPRLGVVYNYNDSANFYLSYSEGFRPNSGADVSGNAFAPEESQAYEAGLKFSLNNNRVSGTVALFHAKKSNILTSDPVNAGFSAALGEAQSEGVELDVSAAVDDNTNLTLAYAYIAAGTSNAMTNLDWGVNIPAGSQLINIPKHSVKLMAQHEFNFAGKDSLIAASLIYVGDRLGETIDPDYILPSYTKVDLSARVALQSHLSVKLVIDNLLDKEYYDNSYSALWTQPGAPRTARLSLKYDF